jgi:predicted nucleotidyltransferase
VAAAAVEILITRIIILVMRINPPKLLPLFRSDMQVNLLGLLLLQPERTWTLDELATAVGAVPSSVHRELRRAVDAGIVERDDRARPHGYSAARDAPAHEPLRQLLETTVGAPAKLAEALAAAGDVRAASLHGSFVRGRLRPDSDLDVLVVADGPSRPFQAAAREAGRALGRDVDLSVLSPREFATATEQGHPFLQGVLRGPRIDLIGDLEQLRAPA